MRWYHSNNSDSLRSTIETLKKDRLKSTALIGEKGFAMCSAAGYANKPPNQLDIDMVQVMEWELEAYLASLSSQEKLAREYFEKAVALDETLNYSFGPPLILKPVHEAYGEWLLSQNNPEDALAIFEKALKRQPRRLLSLKGQQKAATLMKNEAILKKTEAELATSLAIQKREPILFEQLGS